MASRRVVGAAATTATAMKGAAAASPFAPPPTRVGAGAREDGKSLAFFVHRSRVLLSLIHI